MLVFVPRLLLITGLGVGLLAMAGLATGQSINRVAPAPAGNTDFSGAWELDYSASDNARDELNRLVRELRRRMERQSKGQKRCRSK